MSTPSAFVAINRNSVANMAINANTILCANIILNRHRRLCDVLSAKVNPESMFTELIPAVKPLPERSDLTVGCTNIFEVSKTYASVERTRKREVKTDMDRVNPPDLTLSDQCSLIEIAPAVTPSRYSMRRPANGSATEWRAEAEAS